MVLDPMGGIVLTNDGNAILREVCERTCIAQFPDLVFLLLDSSSTSSW
jgi:hypothetical protein